MSNYLFSPILSTFIGFISFWTVLYCWPKKNICAYTWAPTCTTACCIPGNSGSVSPQAATFYILVSAVRVFPFQPFQFQLIAGSGNMYHDWDRPHVIGRSLASMQIQISVLQTSLSNTCYITIRDGLGTVSGNILSPLVILNMERTMAAKVISELKSFSRTLSQPSKSGSLFYICAP